VRVILDRIYEQLFSLARFTITQVLTHRRENVIEILGRQTSFATWTQAAGRS
jgi:hypothetical protein